MIPDEMIAKICAALFLLGDNVSIAKLEEIVTSKSNKESDTVDKVLQLNLNEDSIDRINVE
jgi:hypothetical protein